MNTQIWIGILVSILPIFELRAGLPIIIEYTTRNGISIWPYFFIVVIIDILIVLLIFLLFDFIHGTLMKWGWYKIKMERLLIKLQKKANKIEDKIDRWGYLALVFFVAIPLPGSGSWTGALIVWLLKLNRIKSFIAIAAGIILSGLIILSISLGVFSSIY